MALVTLIALLALSSVATLVTALPTDGNNLALRSVPPCRLVPDEKLATTVCYGDYANGTSPTHFPHRRHRIEERNIIPRNTLPESSEPIKGGWAGFNMTQFCIRDGPKPNPNDIKKLCEKIDNNQIIARTMKKKEKEMDGSCYCKKFNQGTAWFKVCNCDRCDRLEILGGLRDMCKAAINLCACKGFSSGFIKLDEKNGLLVQYNVEPKDAKSGKVDRDPIKARPELTNATCNSKDESKSNQEYTGTKVECWRSWKSLWLAHKCHDHSKDAGKFKSEDYWHNKWIQKNFHDELHNLIGKSEDAFTWDMSPGNGNDYYY
jgi:hypothetical protein